MATHIELDAAVDETLVDGRTRELDAADGDERVDRVVVHEAHDEQQALRPARLVLALGRQREDVLGQRVLGREPDFGAPEQ